MRDILTIQEVAPLLKIPPQALRVRIQRGWYPFGMAFKEKGHRKTHYEIYRAKLEEHLGRELTEEDFA